MSNTTFTSYENYSVSIKNRNFSKSLEIWHNSVSLQKRWFEWTRKFLPDHNVACIKNAGLKQKDFVIALLDLKNAFSKVNCHLLIETFKLHHIPDDLITFILPLHSNYDISVLTDSIMSEFIEAFYKVTPYLCYYLISSETL